MFTTDASGRVLAINDACREVLSRGGDLAEQPSTCCELICDWIVSADGSALCLSERARTARETLPEIRVDLPPRAAISAVWVTAAPLEGGERTVFHLRPGDASDRRRRLQPKSPGAPELHIYVLGPTRIEGGAGRAQDRRWLEQRPGTLLKYLISAGPRSVPASEIATELWPPGEAGAPSSVRYCVHTLRKQLEPERDSRAPSIFIKSSPAGYRIDSERVWIDVLEFEYLVAAGLTALAEGEHTVALESLERAASLYGGDFLTDDPYAEWALSERERFRELAGRALRAAIELRLASEGGLEIAARHARRHADLEPHDAEAQKRHIEMCIRQGHSSEAVRRYDLYRRRLACDFGQAPDFTLAELGHD